MVRPRTQLGLSNFPAIGSHSEGADGEISYIWCGRTGEWGRAQCSTSERAGGRASNGNVDATTSWADARQWPRSTHGAVVATVRQHGGEFDDDAPRLVSPSAGSSWRHGETSPLAHVDEQRLLLLFAFSCSLLLSSLLFVFIRSSANHKSATN